MMIIREQRHFHYFSNCDSNENLAAFEKYLSFGTKDWNRFAPSMEIF